jgi:PPK2 family polyphosphate:nucleotide phosphotransferase
MGKTADAKAKEPSDTGDTGDTFNTGDSLSTNLVIDTERFRVQPGAAVELDKIDPHEIVGFAGDKAVGKAWLPSLGKRLKDLQEMLYAQSKHRLLVVLQAMDTGGKDSTIDHVFEDVNPQGVNVKSFKAPTAPELAHDFLWRVHPHVPGNGEIVIFNRSHYEDVLIVRVHELVPEATWRKRYLHIRNFEEMLVDEGTTVVKFFLYISKDEQKERLQDRLDEPDKHWKFNVDDLAERKRWDDYLAAYAEAIAATSTAAAPWYIVPADRKWFRNLIVSQVLVNTLEAMDLHYPEPEQALDDVEVE